MDDDIIRMAREACETTNWKPGLGNEHVVEFMARFAELVRADEREKLRRRLAALHDELSLASVAEVRMRNER